MSLSRLGEDQCCNNIGDASAAVGTNLSFLKTHAPLMLLHASPEHLSSCLFMFEHAVATAGLDAANVQQLACLWCWC